MKYAHSYLGSTLKPDILEEFGSSSSRKSCAVTDLYDSAEGNIEILVLIHSRRSKLEKGEKF
jgi:hypothetical protein